MTESEESTEDVEDKTEEYSGPTSYGVPVTESHDQVILHPTPAQLLETITLLKEDGFCMAIDVTAVDYLTYPGRKDLPEGLNPERFEVVISLINHEQGKRVRLRVQAGTDNPTVPSLFDLFPGTEAMEREVWDLFGVTFEGHPDHSRILLPDNWEGHPLRKDYEVGRIPVQFSPEVGRH